MTEQATEVSTEQLKTFVAFVSVTCKRRTIGRCPPFHLHLLRLVEPELLLLQAVHLRHDELDLLGHQLALLPGDGLTLLSSSPDLLSNINSFMK